jgi:hypothetical protein
MGDRQRIDAEAMNPLTQEQSQLSLITATLYILNLRCKNVLTR